MLTCEASSLEVYSLLTAILFFRELNHFIVKEHYSRGSYRMSMNIATPLTGSKNLPTWLADARQQRYRSHRKKVLYLHLMDRLLFFAKAFAKSFCEGGGIVLHQCSFGPHIACLSSGRILDQIFY